MSETNSHVVELYIEWNENEYFNAGEKTVRIFWNHTLPKIGQRINILQFLKGQIKDSEYFLYQGTIISLFEWIDQQNGWFIEDTSWGKDEDTIIRQYTVSPTGLIE